MRRLVFATMMVATELWPFGCAIAQSAKSQVSPPTNRIELSYALGYEAGLDLVRREPSVDITTVLRAVSDGYARKSPEYSPQEMQQVISTMEQRMRTSARIAFQKLAAANLMKSNAFFAANSKNPGVVRLASGVEYKALNTGNGHGLSPKIDSLVTIDIRGEFLDGTAFSDTADHGKPAVVSVRYMIPGLRQAIVHMRVGDRWVIFVPPDRAFGARGRLPLIGPNETLVFTIHLLGTKLAPQNPGHR